MAVIHLSPMPKCEQASAVTLATIMAMMPHSKAGVVTSQYMPAQSGLTLRFGRTASAVRTLSTHWRWPAVSRRVPWPFVLRSL